MDINSYITDFEAGEVSPAKGITYNLTDIIDDAYRVRESRFVEAEDSSGLTKIFFNLPWIVFRTIVMASDMDTKDVNTRSLNGRGQIVLPILRNILKTHLKLTNFKQFIDDAMAQLVWFGTTIAKRVDGNCYLVDLKNIIRNPAIRDIQESGLAETIYMSYDQVYSHKDDWDNWDIVELAWKKMQENNDPLFKIIEWWHEKEIDGKVHKVCTTYIDLRENRPDEYRSQTDWTPYIQLDEYITPYKKRRTSKRMIKELGEYEEMYPYEQQNFFEVPGRWLGYGCAELLAGISEQYNESWGLKRKLDMVALRGFMIHKYTSGSNSLRQDMLTNLDTGFVVQMDASEDLQRISIDPHTGDFMTLIDKLYEIARLIMGITAQGTGEELPGSTSATQIVATQKAQQNTYDFVRERMSHFLVNLFNNGYIDDIIDQATSDKVAMMVGDRRQLQNIDKYLVENAVNKKMEQLAPQMAMLETPEERLAVYEEMYMRSMEELRKLGDQRFPEFKKELLKDLDYVVEFYSTNESFDANVKIQNLIRMKMDPMFTGSRRRVDETIMELMQENPIEYAKTEEELALEQQQAMANQSQQEQTMTPPEPISDVQSYNQSNTINPQ